MGGRYVYGFVRRDIPLVNQIVQFGHAAYEHALNLQPFEDKEPSSFVLFEVKDEMELVSVERYLSQNIPNEYSIFYEDYFPKGYTSLITSPFDSDDPKRLLFKKFLLYREPSSVIFTGE